MKKNMGITDRAIRILLAMVLAILILIGEVTGPLAVVLGVVAVVFLGTSFVSFCPLYLPFRISTRKSDSTAAK